MSALIFGWAQGGRPGRGEFVMSVEQARMRRHMTTVLIEELCVQRGDTEAMRWAESVADDAPDAWKAIVLERTMAEIAPRDEALALAFRSWLVKDREAAEAWARSVEPQPALDGSPGSRPRAEHTQLACSVHRRACAQRRPAGCGRRSV